ncbi:isochorismatase family protein [Breoghania sp. JC706]|uniref:isochorismatase family protein n=1 Tax=Breoghania sp. JC706 TaxID=3117732 RepID=UPI0030094C4A
MGLPRIASYELPAAGDIPEPRGPWRVEPGRAALLVHDMQTYFVRAFDRSEAPIAPAIANMARLIEHARALEIPVFYTAQTGDQDRRDRGLQADLWGPGMSNDPGETAIIDELRPKAGERVLVKHRYSAFQRSNLEPLMRVRGRDQLIVTGIYAHIGCLMTASEAFQRDFETFVVADAMADFSRAEHDMALRWVAGRCGVAMTTEAMLAALGAAPALGDVLTRERMRADIAAMIHEDPDEIADDDNLIDLGLDSMRAMTLVTGWRDLGLDLDFAEFAQDPTLSSWWAAVERRLPKMAA